MATIVRIRRGLMARVPAIIDVTFTDGDIPVAHVVVPEATAEIKVEVERALRMVISAGTMVNADVIERAVDGSAVPVGPHYLASLAGDASVDGVIRAVERLVPEIAQVVIGDMVDRTVHVRVADARGECSDALRIAAAKAVGSVLALGIPVEVSPLLPSDRKPTHEDFPSAARTNKRLRDLAHEDEERFANRITKLTTNETADRVPLVDDLEGEKICTTIGGPEAATVGTFLPLYDRILLLMVPDGGPGTDYYQRHYGMSEDVLLAYVRARKITPIFKFELGRYPELVWRRFLEDPSLPLVTARDLDYMCARNIWQSSGWLRELREDREVTSLMHRFLDGMHGGPPPLRSFSSTLRMALLGAEAFEGDMWHRGHLGAGQYSPALPLVEIMREFVRNQPTKSMGLIDAHGAAMHLAISQALGAAAHEGLVSNERLLLEVAKLFGGEPSSMFTWTQGTRLAEVLRGLELSFSDAIPPDEYMQIFDEANTKRIRALVSELVQREEAHTELEIRELVQTFNQGVDRIARNAVDKAEVSLVASGAGKALGVPLMGTVLETGASIGGMFGRMVDARTGTALDRIRGWINRVPSQSVRLYKIRRRLRAATRR